MSSDPHAILFANPRSGGTRKKFFNAVEALEAARVHLVATHFDLADASLAASLRKAKQNGVRTILVAGGDGTVGTLANHLANSDFVLGVMPTGTSNDFARSLSIPMAMERAAGVVAQGVEALVDVGVANDVLFVHAATAGINVEFAETVHRLRPYLGRASYPVASLLVYKTRKRLHFEIVRDGQAEKLEAFEVAFVNTPAIAGPLGIEVPETEADSGSLAEVTVKAMDLRSVLLDLPAVFRRETMSVSGAPVRRVKEATVAAERELRVTLDGEVLAKTPLKIGVLPGALRVLVPTSYFGRHEHAR